MSRYTNLQISWRLHALDALIERKLEKAWVEHTIAFPDWTEPDPGDPEVTRLFRAIPECGGRILRVVVAFETSDRCRVITVLLDRDARRPL